MTDTQARVEHAGVDPQAFARRYLAHAGSQVPGRSASSLAELARTQLAFGRVRRADETLIDAVDLDGDTTAINVVTADAPFLVESVRTELDRAGTPIERVLHPQMVVRRDEDGALVHVYDIDDNADVPDGATVESWMHIEID
ncbi:MAG: glutamate dehydrogenase, partial [Pseudonocardiales bacterium]|nr:glutamate dehydrogenase [Pseudonocardiales bacterium]